MENEKRNEFWPFSSLFTATGGAQRTPTDHLFCLRDAFQFADNNLDLSSARVRGDKSVMLPTKM